MADETRQHLKTLGLMPGASTAEVKQAYRELAAIWHPDRHAHAPQMQAAAQTKMAEINAAYNYLKTHGSGPLQASSSTPASRSASEYRAPRTPPAPPTSPASPPSEVPLLRVLHILRVSFAAAQPVNGLVFAPDGSLILAATGSHAVWWDAQTGQQAQGIAVSKGSVDGVAAASKGAASGVCQQPDGLDGRGAVRTARVRPANRA